eukprot:scaffold122308_cov63-Phaeocystis_antarctica.AAC.3
MQHSGTLNRTLASCHATEPSEHHNTRLYTPALQSHLPFPGSKSSAFCSSVSPCICSEPLKGWHSGKGSGLPVAQKKPKAPPSPPVLPTVRSIT